MKKSARRRRSTRQPPLVLHCLDPSRRRAAAGIICCDGALHCSPPRTERVNVQGQRTKGASTQLERRPEVAGRPNRCTHARCGRAQLMVGGGLSSVSTARVLSALSRAALRLACLYWRACVPIARVQDSTSTVTLALSEQNETAQDPSCHAWHLSRRIGPENRNLNPVPPKYLVADFYASPTNVIGLHLCDVTSRRAGLADPGEGPATGVAVVLSSDSRCFYTESW